MTANEFPQEGCRDNLFALAFNGNSLWPFGMMVNNDKKMGVLSVPRSWQGTKEVDAHSVERPLSFVKIRPIRASVLGLRVLTRAA
jgi:hypothetical protein